MAEQDLSFMDYGTKPVKQKKQAADEALSFMDYQPPAETESQGGALDDVVKSIGQGALQLPGAVTGLADIPAGLLGFNRPFDKASDALGKATGFQPGKWADETTFSPALTESRADVDKVWDNKDAGALDVAKAYAQNPSVAANLVAQSIPSLFAGGVVAKGLGKLGQLSGAARGALGEGTVMAGQSMEGIDASVDPRIAALTSLGVGAIGAGVGAVGGKLANRAGVGDPETLVAGGARQALPASTALPAYKRVPLGMGLEAGEEVAQSTAETGLQNLAEGKAFNEGLARAQVEGGLAGGLMGGASNIVPQAQVVNSAGNKTTPDTQTQQPPEWTSPAFKDRNYQAETKPFFGEPLYNKIPGQTLNEQGVRQAMPKGPLARIVPQTQVNTDAEKNTEPARGSTIREDAGGNKPLERAEQNNEAAYQNPAPESKADSLPDAKNRTAIKADPDNPRNQRKIISNEQEKTGQREISAAGSDAAEKQGAVDSDNRAVGTGGLATAESDAAGSYDKNTQGEAEKAGILSKTKTGYIKARLKQQGVNVKSPDYKSQRDLLLKTYERDINQARFSLPFAQFKQLKGNKGVSEELLLDSYQNGRANLELSNEPSTTRQQKAPTASTDKPEDSRAQNSTGEPLQINSPLPGQEPAVLPQGNEPQSADRQGNASINSEAALKRQKTQTKEASQGVQDKSEKPDKLPYLSQKESEDIRRLDKGDVSADYLRGRFGTDRLSNDEAQAVFDALDMGKNTAINTDNNVSTASDNKATNKTAKKKPVINDGGVSKNSQDSTQGKTDLPGGAMDKKTTSTQTAALNEPDTQNKPVSPAKDNNKADAATKKKQTRNALADKNKAAAATPQQKPVDDKQAAEKAAPSTQETERAYQENEALREAVKKQTDTQFPQKIYDTNSRSLKTSARDFVRHNVFNDSVLEEKDGKFYLSDTKKSKPVKITKQAYLYGKAYQANLAEAQAKKKASKAATPDNKHSEKNKVAKENKKATDTNRQADTSKKDKAQKIEDFGEVLAGANKHTYNFTQAFEEDIDLETAALSKSFPLPDYVKMVADGIDPVTVATIAQIRGGIKLKPRRKGSMLNKWKNNLNNAIFITKGLIAGSIKANEAYDNDVQIQLAQIANDIPPENIKNLGHYKIFRNTFTDFNIGRIDESKTSWSMSNSAISQGARRILERKRFKTKQEVLNLIKSKLREPKASKTVRKTTFDIWTNRLSPGKHFVGKKIAAGKFVPLKTFDSYNEAREYKDNNYDELVKLLKKKKTPPVIRRETNDPRIGEDYRKGKDVTPELFNDTFGFRGVQFGNWVEGGRRQQDLNNAYDGLLDLASVIGVPPKALSLNGSLGLAFGARGKGGKNAASAHYEPSGVNINLTKISGRGSLAHEFFHALDNYFGKLDKSSVFLTEGKRDRYKRDKARNLVELTDADFNVRKKVYDAWKGLDKAIGNETKLVQRSRVLDKTRSKDYWGTVRELTARTFERYVIDKLAEKGFKSDYLANVVSEPAQKADNEVNGEESDYPYPLASEMDAVNKAYDKLFNTLKTKETDKGVALFSKVPQKTTSTVSQIKARLPRRVKKLLDSGKLQVVSNNNELPDGLQSQVDSNVQALYQESTDSIYLIAENLAESDITAVLNHELFHRFLAQNPALKEKLIGQQGAVLDAFTDLYDTKYNKAYRPMMRESMRRVIAADTNAQHKVEELAAYLVELYSETPQSIPAKLRKLVRDLVATIKGIALRAGIPVSKITPADLAALARRGAKVDNKVAEADSVKASKSATKSVQANIKRGKAAMNKALLYKTSVHRAMFRNGMGWVDFVWGDEGKAPGKKGKRKGAKGISHIIEARQRKDGLSQAQAQAILFDLVETIAKGEEVGRFEINNSTKIRVAYGNKLASLSRRKGSNSWLITGYEIYPDGDSSGNDALSPTHFESTLTRNEAGAGNNNIPQDSDSSSIKFSKTRPKDIVSAESVSNILGELFTKRPDTPIKNDLINTWRKFNVARRRHQLGVLSVRQLLEVAKHTLPTLSHDFQFNKDAMDANINELDTVADKIYSQGLKLKREDADWLSGVAHEATIAGVDPAEAFKNETDVPQALKDIEKHREEIAAHLESIRKTRGKIRLRPGDAPALMEFIEQVQRQIKNRRADIKSLETGMAHDTNRLKQYQGLKQKFDMLSPDAQAVYREVRDFYQSREVDRKQAIIERIEDSALRGKAKREAIDAVKQLWEQNAVSKPYFPLTRHGAFWLSFVENDESNYMTFESVEDMNEFVKENSHVKISGQGKYLEGFNQMEGVNAGFVTDVDAMIKEQLGESPETADLRDAIYQRFLESLPALSMRKHQIHRKKVKGFSNDLLRSFAKKSGHDVRQTARIKYGFKLSQTIEDAKESLAMSNSVYQMQQGRIKSEALREFVENKYTTDEARELLDKAADAETNKYKLIVDYAKDFKGHGDIDSFSEMLAHNESLLAAARTMGSDFEFASNVLDETALAYQDMMNPSTSPIAQLVNGIGFTWFLGLSPAAALVNTLQVPGVSVPYVGAMYGMKKTTAAFTRAYKDFFAGKNTDKEVSIYSKLNKDEKDAYEVWHKQGLLDKTRTHDLMQSAEHGIESGKGRRLMSKLVGGMFHHAERSNREVTAIATYRLAREAGENHHQAIKIAEKATWDTHLDYNSNNRARAFRGNAARVMTQFKQYSQGMTFLYYKTAFDGLKNSNLSKEEKTLAKKQLAYMLGAQFAVAGAAGLPLGISGISILMAVVEDAFDDEDEPFDLDLYIRTQTANLLGNKTAEALTKGVSAFLPMDIHSRLEQRNMWIRGSDRDSGGRDEAYGFTKLLLGPTGGLIENFFVGKQLIGEDKEWRGVEKLMPKAFRDIMKSIRYASEDVENLRGDRIYETDAIDVITQSLGFSPQRLSERYGQNSAFKKLEKTLSSRRGYLIARAANAKNDGDKAAYDKAIKAINRFNTVWKDDAAIKIPMKSVFASARTRKRYSENADHGIIVSKRYRDVVKQAGYLN